MSSIRYSEVWSNSDISKSDWVSTCILLLVTYLFIFHLFVPLGNRFAAVKKIDRTCLVSNSNSTIGKLTKLSRGKQYYLTGDSDKDLSTCGVTLWEGSHVMMHAFIGYWLDLRWSLLIGGAFEAWEWREHRCENVLDIAYNSVGAIIGGLLRVYIQ